MVAPFYLSEWCLRPSHSDCTEVHGFLHAFQSLILLCLPVGGGRWVCYAQPVGKHPAHSYAYVYSLKTKTWGMMQSTVADNVPSYPEALAMLKAGTLVDFCTNATKQQEENRQQKENKN